jgi:hypothetical protein
MPIPVLGWVALAGINAALAASKAAQARKQRETEANIRAAEIEASPWTGKAPSTQVSTPTSNIYADLAGAGINTLGQAAALQAAGLFKEGATAAATAGGAADTATGAATAGGAADTATGAATAGGAADTATGAVTDAVTDAATQGAAQAMLTQDLFELTTKNQTLMPPSAPSIAEAFDPFQQASFLNPLGNKRNLWMQMFKK